MDQSSKVSAVVERVRTLVHDGTLRAGDPLPSTRALAAELGVARGTVVAAYDQLDGEGYIRTRPGAAARVVAGARRGAHRRHGRRSDHRRLPPGHPRRHRDQRAGLARCLACRGRCAAPQRTVRPRGTPRAP
ncbi:hypothetical protein DEI91_15720 [Curtobacterium sp. MCBD17_032]|nr:hypothetical protein DEI91_15720 [Curtobacterium sp. MCBD17_032]